MRVTLSYFGPLRHAAGVDGETRHCQEGSTLTDVLKEAATDQGERFAAILFGEAGELLSSVLVLVNDMPVNKDPSSQLRDGDQVVLLPAIAGGSQFVSV